MILHDQADFIYFMLSGDRRKQPVASCFISVRVVIFRVGYEKADTRSITSSMLALTINTIRNLKDVFHDERYKPITSKTQMRWLYPSQGMTSLPISAGGVISHPKQKYHDGEADDHDDGISQVARPELEDAPQQLMSQGVTHGRWAQAHRFVWPLRIKPQDPVVYHEFLSFFPEFPSRKMEFSGFSRGFSCPKIWRVPTSIPGRPLRSLARGIGVCSGGSSE